MDTIFFPRNDYPNNVEVCPHRLGKLMTYTEQTDGLHVAVSPVSYDWFMGLAKARNIKVGCFMGLNSPTIDDPNGDVKADYLDGKIWLDAYSMAPNIASKIPQSGEAGIITQEEWNAAYTDYILPNFKAFTGKKPVVLSYSYGNITFQNYITQFLAARNSAYDGYTDYGIGYGNPNNRAYSFSNFKSKSSTTRWYDYAKTHENDFNGTLSTVASKIDETLQNGGWMNNFTHWHNYVSNNDQEWAETYLDLLATKNANGEIYFAGYGEAVAYLVYRQLVTKVSMYTPISNQNRLVIRLEAVNTLGVDTDLLQVPLSVSFSTADTPLANQEIKSNCNLINKGNNQYIVEIPYRTYPIAVIDKV